jgi:hypothetical protein
VSIAGDCLHRQMIQNSVCVSDFVLVAVGASVGAYTRPINAATIVPIVKIF